MRIGIGLGIVDASRRRFGASPTPTPTPTMRFIGNRMGLRSVSSAGSPAGGAWAAGGGLTMRSAHYVGPTGGATGLRLLYSGYRSETATGETPQGNDQTHKPALEYGGTTKPARSGGSDTFTVGSGVAVVATDVIGDLPSTGAIQTIYARDYSTVPAGGKMAIGLWPANTWRNGSLTGTPAAGPDAAYATGTLAASTNIETPLALVGFPDNLGHKAILVVGHSFDSGEGDPAGDANGYRGYIQRGLGSDAAWVFHGKGSSGLNDILANGTNVLLALAPYANHALIGRWDNDFYLRARTEAQTKASIIGIAQALKTANPTIKIRTRTAPPRTTGTQTSAATQVVINGNATRVSINDWIRDGLPINSADGTPAAIGASAGVIRAGNAAHPYVGFLEIADLVEVNAANVFTRNGGVNYAGPGNDTALSADGVHYNATGVPYLAAGCSAAAFN